MNQKISKHDIHPCDKFIKLLGNRSFVIIFTIIMFICGILISSINNNWIWFSRFGSLITISGLFLTMSPIFMKGIYLSQSGAGRLGSLDENKDLMITLPEERKIGTSVFIGIIISIIGTLIWGFGDLIIKII